MDESHASMAVSVDAALVALWISEPSLEFVIVFGQIRIVAADKEAWRKALHGFGHMLADGMLVLFQGLLKRMECLFALLG